MSTSVTVRCDYLLSVTYTGSNYTASLYQNGTLVNTLHGHQLRRPRLEHRRGHERLLQFRVLPDRGDGVHVHLVRPGIDFDGRFDVGIQSLCDPQGRVLRQFHRLTFDHSRKSRRQPHAHPGRHGDELDQRLGDLGTEQRHRHYDRNQRDVDEAVARPRLSRSRREAGDRDVHDHCR